MRLYFNLVSSSQSIIDDEGAEVADLEEARTVVLEVAAGMVQKGEAVIADWQEWHLEVVDPSGATLCAIRLDAEVKLLELHH